MAEWATIKDNVFGTTWCLMKRFPHLYMSGVQRNCSVKQHTICIAIRQLTMIVLSRVGRLVIIWSVAVIAVHFCSMSANGFGGQVDFFFFKTFIIFLGWCKWSFTEMSLIEECWILGQCLCGSLVVNEAGFGFGVSGWVLHECKTFCRLKSSACKCSGLTVSWSAHSRGHTLCSVDCKEAFRCSVSCIIGL